MSHPHVVGWFHLLFLAHNHFIKSKIGNRKIPFLVTKRSQKSYPICFSDPRPRNYAWFHLLFLTHHIFIKPETQKRKIPFLVTKRNQKLNLINFSDLRHPNCQWFQSLLFTNLTESKNLIFLRMLSQCKILHFKIIFFINDTTLKDDATRRSQCSTSE